MKCELCHQAEAQRAIHKLVNNEQQELYVCNACAEAQQQPKKKPLPEAPPAQTLQEPPPEVMEVIKETLPEIMGMILGATVEFSGRLQSSKEQLCPFCGISRSEYKKVARLGCARCYETFVKDVDGIVDEMHRIPRHKGKAPKHPRPSPLVLQFMKDLRTAEQEQRPADVETLKTRIQQLGWDPASAEEFFRHD